MANTTPTDLIFTFEISLSHVKVLDGVYFFKKSDGLWTAGRLGLTMKRARFGYILHDAQGRKLGPIPA